MLYIKHGIDKASGQPIYPHPTQTSTGNCAAYAAAACLYAFGLDHEPDLIPEGEGGTDGEKFQYKISKMVERLTELIYKDGQSKADAMRKYIDDSGLHCKFDISELPLRVIEYDHIAGNDKYVTNIPHIIEEMKRCQDILLSLQWGGAIYNPFKKTHRHCVGLVGVDEGTGELILNNPWGASVHVNPADAEANTNSGTGDRFTRHKYHVDEDGYTYVPIGSDEAYIYACVMVCPAEPHAVAVNSRSRPAGGDAVEREREAAAHRLFEYEVANTSASGPVNGLAVELSGLAPENVVSLGAPAGWKAGLWYRDRELAFDFLAPEAVLDQSRPTFAGVIWRCREGGVEPGDRLAGFAVELQVPHPCVAGQGSPDDWFEDPHGHGVVTSDRNGAVTAWHVSALAPAQRRVTRPHAHPMREG